MSAGGDLPAELQKVIAAVPTECQIRLLELHGKYHFNDDQLDCFLVNHKALTADNLPAFARFLEEEAAKASKPAKPARAAPAGGKRKTVAASQSALPRGIGAALGFVPTIVTPTESQASTPFPKRIREMQESVTDVKDSAEGGPSAGTPPKQLQVSLKSSLNNGNLAKPAVKSVQASLKVEVLGDSKLWASSRNGVYRWVDESLEERAAARGARLAALEAEVVAAMLQRHEGEDVSPGTIGVPVQSQVVLCGRVLCEGLEGRLNERSMLLEGSRASANGARVQLNVAECKEIAAFPGQIVGVLGRSGMTGTTFHARDFIAGLPLQPVASPGGESPLHMMVVAGPFCLRDSLDYAPLEQALRHAVRERPQVLVILGPLLDAGNQKVASGDTVLPGGDDEPSTYEEVYGRHVLPLLQRCLAPLRKTNPLTEVLIVPSLEETLCFHPLPQPPLDAALGPCVEPGALEQLQRLGVQFLPNPAHLRINGLKVSLTSADALSPVLREIVLRPEGRKIDEALRLLLQQRSLFPVVPRDPPQVSEARAAALDFPEGVPDVCIFPSVSGTATGTIIGDTVFVNPGPICRPAALGSFAEFWLVPSGGSSLKERVRVDIQKLS